MAQNWRHFLDDDYEDEHQKVQRIPHKPKPTDDKPKQKERPKTQEK